MRNLWHGMVGLICLTLVSCSAVTETANSTEQGYKKVGNYLGEASQNVVDAKNTVVAEIKENSLIRLFRDDKDIIKNREKHFVKWQASSSFNPTNIYSQYLRTSGLGGSVSDLNTSQKMVVLKDYFYDYKKQQHTRAFKTKHQKPTFDEFLTDVENINAIHSYKMALLDAEHKWEVESKQIKKEVAQLSLSTLYGKPVLKYLSYDPDDEEMFFSLVSERGNFKEKIKTDVKKDLARKVKQQVRRVQPKLFFEFSDNSLSLLAIHLELDKQTFLTDIVEQEFVRNSDIKFVSKSLTLEEEDISYTEQIKNLTPPDWYLSSEFGDNVAFGQGLSVDEAVNEAVKSIAKSRNVTVSGTEYSKVNKAGDQSTSSYSSNYQQTVDGVKIKSHKSIKQSLKSGLWFVAISYEL